MILGMVSKTFLWNMSIFDTFFRLYLVGRLMRGSVKASLNLKRITLILIL